MTETSPSPAEGARPRAFVAIDFETADRGADSACAVALVRVEDGQIVHRVTRLIRPPRARFEFTYIHGITWTQVAGEPAFADVWPELAPVLEGADFLAAHNARFDRNVLSTCCAAAGLALPAVPFACTVQLARRAWNLRPTRLPDVCAFLGIPLKHHDAASDAEACARIVVAADVAAPSLLSAAAAAKTPRRTGRVRARATASAAKPAKPVTLPLPLLPPPAALPVLRAARAHALPTPVTALPPAPPHPAATPLLAPPAEPVSDRATLVRERVRARIAQLRAEREAAAAARRTR